MSRHARSDGPPVRAPGGRRAAKRQPARVRDEVAEWLASVGAELLERWSEEITARSDARDEDPVVTRFASEIVRMLPALVGPDARRVQPLWDRLTELYGAIGVQRGLAAGEIIEEFHLLRELVIRALFTEEGAEVRALITFRDILRLNRVLDRGVTYASVGHTDALFFELFRRDGEEPSRPVPGVPGEAAAQLDAIREELAEVLAGPVGAQAGVASDG